MNFSCKITLTIIIRDFARKIRARAKISRETSNLVQDMCLQQEVPVFHVGARDFKVTLKCTFYLDIFSVSVSKCRVFFVQQN